MQLQNYKLLLYTTIVHILQYYNTKEKYFLFTHTMKVVNDLHGKSIINFINLYQI